MSKMFHLLINIEQLRFLKILNHHRYAVEDSAGNMINRHVGS